MKVHYLPFIAVLVYLHQGCSSSAPPTPIAQQRCDFASLRTLPADKASIPQVHGRSLYSSSAMPRVQDVVQASFDVCYFYAFLSAYVNKYPQKIKDSIVPHDGGFEVRVFDQNSLKPCIFISDKQFDIFYRSSKANTNYIWPEVLAGAWVSYLKQSELSNATDKAVKLTGTDREKGISELLLGHTIDLSMVMRDPFLFFLDKKGKMRRLKPKAGTAKTSDFFNDAEAMFNFIDTCLQAGCIMYAYVAPQKETQLPNGLYSHHCYGILGVDAATQKIILRNPHGGAARAVAYENDGMTMKPGRQYNDRFLMRAEDFFTEFYTLQFSEF